MFLQKRINGPDDKSHDWQGSIENTPAHTQRRIVFFQKILVEVNDRIVCFLFQTHLPVKTMHEVMDITVHKYITKFIHDKREFFQKVCPRDVVEELLQEMIAGGDLFSGFGTGKCFGSVVVVPRDEESVNQCLSIEIGELDGCAVMNKLGFQNLHHVLNIAFLSCECRI